MIKFFRHIRQSLLSENKFKKYLIYAVGEIILVFIGIAMALQFNNWNEAKKTREKEQQVLTEIISDLEFTLQDLDRVINTRTNNLKRTINSIHTVIDILETNKPYHDSLAYTFRSINAYDDIHFKTSGYQSLVSIGTDLVEDPKLRSSIGEFHTSSIKETKGRFEEVHLDFYSYMIDNYRKKYTSVFDENSLERLIPNDFETLKKDKEYIQSLKVFLGVNISYLEILTEVNLEAEKLKEDIENYLE
ncbi:DUF6090 family protein [Winogradskyella damuponensis]|jgi:Family of unknown function (DUF6090)|uniref:Uncharacterized protein n=1 Tax=Winogradskyella damuponensis TaxID=943939 RepID=A0ABP8CMR4_9FLAO